MGGLDSDIRGWDLEIFVPPGLEPSSLGSGLQDGPTLTVPPGERMHEGIRSTHRPQEDTMGLEKADRDIRGMGEHTQAPNKLPAPSATAGSTMGSKPTHRGTKSVPGLQR